MRLFVDVAGVDSERLVVNSKTVQFDGSSAERRCAMVDHSRKVVSVELSRPMPESRVPEVQEAVKIRSSPREVISGLPDSKTLSIHSGTIPALNAWG